MYIYIFRHSQAGPAGPALTACSMVKKVALSLLALIPFLSITGYVIPSIRTTHNRQLVKYHI